jgi:hypothetical protein
MSAQMPGAAAKANLPGTLFTPVRMNLTAAACCSRGLLHQLELAWRPGALRQTLPQRQPQMH